VIPKLPTSSKVGVSHGPKLQALAELRAHRSRGGEEYSEGRRSMQDDQTAQDASRLLVAFRTNHEEAKMVSPEARRSSPFFGMGRTFVPNWADAEYAGLDRARRDNAMRWLVDNDMLERDEEAEKPLAKGEGLPDYDFGSAFRITDSGQELLEEIRQERGRQ
jgi:hypothetical protein